MKLASSRPTTHSDRLDALEKVRTSDGERLDKIETMVSEIHEILVKARGIKWVFDNLFKVIGYIAAVTIPAIGAWKFFTGH